MRWGGFIAMSCLLLAACGGVLLEDDGGTDAAPAKDGGTDAIVSDVSVKDVIAIDTSTCAPPFVQCGALCVDTSSDPNHCGGCTNVCAAVDGGTAACVSGVCSVTCGSGTELCNGVCVDTQTDPNNCGGCGSPCPPQSTCSGGTCGTATTGATYSESFTTLVVATQQCTDWNNWRAGLTGTYTSITLSGSNDTTGRTCTGAAASTLCQALHDGTKVIDLSCGGFTWSVDFCSGMTWELTADGAACTCTNPGYNIRPCINSNGDWGGITTKTCAAPSQTLSVTCQ
jgi:hypothetical protein